MTVALIIGASGNIGSRLVQELDMNHGGLDVRLSTSRPELAQKWQAEGRDAVVLDLDRPETFKNALTGVDRLFLLTGYTAAMLYQSKMLIHAARQAGVQHLVHLGVYNSAPAPVPHYVWHELIETYIESTGMSWTHLHPNSIIESTLAIEPPVTKSGSFSVPWGEAPQGWVTAGDIAAVAAVVLREGPATHAGKNYWLSSELLTGPQLAEIVSDTLGTDITCTIQGPDDLAAYVETIPSAGTRLYMESAVQKMRQTIAGNMTFEAEVHTDIETVLGRPATTIAEWTRTNLTTT